MTTRPFESAARVRGVEAVEEERHPAERVLDGADAEPRVSLEDTRHEHVRERDLHVLVPGGDQRRARAAVVLVGHAGRRRERGDVEAQSGRLM